MSEEDFIEIEKERRGYYNLSPEKQQYFDKNDTDGVPAIMRERTTAIEIAIAGGKNVPLQYCPPWAITCQQYASRQGVVVGDIKKEHELIIEQAIAAGLAVPLFNFDGAHSCGITSPD